MTYTPINWQTGDTITAEKMNKMDNGWGISETQLFSETVTTTAGQYGNEGSLSYAGQVTADEVTVTFDGTEYQCPLIIVNGDGRGYGGVTSTWEYELDTYPFALVFSESDGNVIATKTAGSHSVSVSNGIVETSGNFNAAVESVVDTNAIPLRCVSGETTEDEMSTAFYTDNRPLYFFADSTCFYITKVATNNISFVPTSNRVTASFSNNVFTVTIS